MVWDSKQFLSFLLSLWDSDQSQRWKISEWNWFEHFSKKLKIKKGMGKEYIHVDVWLRTSGLEKKSITLGPHLQLIESPTAQFLTL